MTRAAPLPTLAASLLALALSLASASPARAQGDPITGELLPGWRMENGRHMAGLRLVLAPGWKTYWRAPGDAGIPPRFDWAGSDNLAGVTVHWPTPEVTSTAGLRTIGYSEAVTLPLEIVPGPAGGPIRARAVVDLGVCRDICLPARITVAADLPERGEGGGTHLIRGALAARPLAAAAAGAGPATCRIAPIADGMQVTATIALPGLPREAVTVVEVADPTVWVSEAVTRREGGTLTAVADLVPARAGPFALARGDLRLTVIGGGRAVEFDGCAAP